MITQPVSNRTEPKIQVFRCELQSFSWPRVVWPNTCLVPLALEFLGLNYCNHAVWNRIRSLSLYWTFSKSDKTQKLCSEGNLGSTYGYSFQVRCLQASFPSWLGCQEVGLASAGSTGSRSPSICWAVRSGTHYCRVFTEGRGRFKETCLKHMQSLPFHIHSFLNQVKAAAC